MWLPSLRIAAPIGIQYGLDWIGLERIIISREILKSDVMDCIDGMGMGIEWIGLD